ncbi:phospholipase D family protein [Ruminococcaceae bacterium OttesenSCG-928-L11]|nr:phospholipase D family protein [Ruminococcaceae bacterium OttesenSCG-928-L11]
MLNAQSDRVDYRELLSPPPGYKTAFATGTTYSLDLETLTAICAIIGLDTPADTELIQSPLHTLEAIRRASGNLLIFCQSGQIKCPDKPNKLLPLLENCVSEVSLANKKSFHPKTWFLRYTAEGLPDKFRMIVLSRNLTFDRSWDVALRLDSAGKGDAVLEQYETTGDAISSFLQWLQQNLRAHNNALKAKRKKLTSLAEELPKTNWKSFGKEFAGFDFIPYGIQGPSTDNLGESFHKMFVISPFLSKSVIEGFAKNRLTNPDCTLITRKSELYKLDSELLTAFNTYTIKDDVVDGEQRISETGDFKTQDIHAKVYLRTKWSDSELYVGSANASYNAFHGGNVECMIALWGKQRYLNVDKLKQDLFGTDERANPFEKALPMDYTQPDEDTTVSMLETAIRDFCSLRKSAVVSGEDSYTITVTSKSFQCDAQLTLSPLMRDKTEVFSESMTFSGLRLRDLSEWYVVTAKSRGKELSRVLKIQTDRIPYNRDSAVFSDVVKDRNAFLHYIAFLLSDDYLTAFLDSIKKGSGDYQFLNTSFDAPILYERMLKAAANDKDSLREIRAVIALANDNVVPQEFLRLYEQFEKVVKK